MKSGTTTQFVHELLALQRERATGVLSVTAADVQTRLYFRNGRVVFAEEGTLNETLGRLLVSAGAITQEQYAEAIDVMQQYLAANIPARMGEVLVALGFLSVDAIQEALVAQTRRRIARLVQFPKLSWEMSPDAERLARVPNYPMRVEPQLYSGVRLYYGRKRMAALLAPYLDAFTMLRAETQLIERCFALLPDETSRVSSIDGTATLKRWLMAQNEDDAWPLATVLAMTGVLAATAAPPSVGTRARASKNPSLAPPGSTGVFELALVRSQALKPAKLPDAVSPPEDPKARGQYERVGAEGAMQRGLEHLQAELFNEAAQAFDEAARAMPNVLEYELYRAWAQFRARGSLDTRAADELGSLARDTAKQDSQHAFPSYVLGHVALARGDHETALRWFRIATHRDPDNKDAAELARRLASGTG